jgi:predicted MFS family arabinose efflux permease
MAAGFSIIPNISAFLQLNLLFPRDHLKYAYMFGGVASFFATQFGGRFVDRFGSFKVGTAGAVSVIAVVATVYVPSWERWPVGLIYLSFVAFMLANGVRNVSYNTLASKVPEPPVRARFQSMQSAFQHGASALAAIAASQVLGREPRPDGLGPRLTHMNWVALGSITLTLIIPVLLFVVERRVKAAQAAPVPSVPAAGARSPA